MDRDADKPFAQDADLSRREVLGLMGATAAATLVSRIDLLAAPLAPAGGARDTGAAGKSAAGVAPSPPPACVVRPEQTEGPYFLDERLERSDVRSDAGGGPLVAGVPLALLFRVSRVDGASCRPLPARSSTSGSATPSASTPASATSTACSTPATARSCAATR